MPRRREPEPEPIKGDAIRFVGGEFKGRRGWLNEAKPSTNDFSYVIVKYKFNDEDSEFIDYPTRVRKIYIEPGFGICTSYGEQVVETHTDVDCKLEELAKLLVDCKISEVNLTALGIMLKERVRKYEQYKKKKGHKAMYRVTFFYGDEAASNQCFEH